MAFSLLSYLPFSCQFFVTGSSHHFALSTKHINNLIRKDPGPYTNLNNSWEYKHTQKGGKLFSLFLHLQTAEETWELFKCVL